jgi:hypothetical protein
MDQDPAREQDSTRATIAKEQERRSLKMMKGWDQELYEASTVLYPVSDDSTHGDSSGYVSEWGYW